MGTSSSYKIILGFHQPLEIQLKSRICKQSMRHYKILCFGLNDAIEISIQVISMKSGSHPYVLFLLTFDQLPKMILGDSDLH